LPVAVQVGIIVGGVLGALLLVAIIAWTIRRITRAREAKRAAQGIYAPIVDMAAGARDGPSYSGTGEMIPGHHLYQGGQAPRSMPAGSGGVARKPTFIGGYKPSSSASRYVPHESAIMSQYSPEYRPASKRSNSAAV
jgi:hypothetical protein